MPTLTNNSVSSPPPGYQRPRVGVLGATLGTGNLGVDALGMSMVQGLVAAIPDVEVVYQSWDLRLPVTIPSERGPISCESLAIRRKGTLRHRDGLSQIKKIAQLRTWLSGRSIPQLPTFSAALKQLLSCDAILDVSAGDSFANIYGDEVFWYQTQLKLLCLELGIPLVLMPQTYGPFKDAESEKIAGNILSRAAMVCTREENGIQEIKQLCSDQPPKRLVRVPDMAFLLEPSEAELPARFLAAKDRGAPCIALNVSGLLYFARRSFGLQEDYKQLIARLLDWALSIPESHVLLVPHVVAPTLYPGAKSPSVSSLDTTDTDACQKLIEEVSEDLSERVDVLATPKDPAQAKYAIKHCDYFVGARMHAFIGAVSQCVPGTLLAYSKKADGLASLLRIGDSVVDLRNTSIDDCIAEVESQYQRRLATTERLEERVPEAKDELRRFFREDIASLVLGKNRPLPISGYQTETEQGRVLS